MKIDLLTYGVDSFLTLERNWHGNTYKLFLHNFTS